MKLFTNVLQIFCGREKKLSAALSATLFSRHGEEGQELFLRRIHAQAPAFLEQWKQIQKKQNYTELPAIVDYFCKGVLDVHIVDKKFPAYRTSGIFQNSFAPVSVMRTLAECCTGKGSAWQFLRMLTEYAPDKHCHWAAYAGSLLDVGKFREAADAALTARRLAEYDYCCSRIVNDTQKALADNGFEPDLPINSTDNSDRFCDMPFVNLKYSTSLAGDEYISPTICFSMAWLPIAFDHDFSWNSEDMQELRRSILDGSFKYCDECRCVPMRDGVLPRKSDIVDTYLLDIIDNNKVELEQGPKRLLFAYDISCNISCPSCRPDVRMASAETTNILNAYMDKELPPLLPDVCEITISQSGEALASKHSLRILKSLTLQKYPRLKVELFTNMSLVSPKTWDYLGESAQCIKKIFMSVDGATPATLEKLRRGLKWPKLIEALEFVRNMRKKGDIEGTTLQFIIQKDNFRELRQLLDLASTYSIDTLMISKIESHGSYGSEEFHALNVGDPANPLFNEYKAAIEDAKEYYAYLCKNAETKCSDERKVPKLIWRLF